MPTMHAPRISTLVVVLASSLVAACGSSAEHARNDGPPVVPTVAPSASAAPRALKTAGLAGTSPQNLLLDPMFMSSQSGDLGWGHFLALNAQGTQLATFSTLTYGATPLGVGSPVAALPDKLAAAATAQTLWMFAPFVGGPGACSAKIWVSKNDPSGQPDTFDPQPTALRVSITGVANSTATGAAWDLQRDDASTQVIAGRTWYLYRGEIASGLADGGFFSIRGGRLGGNFWLTGPEVVPKDLAPLPSTMSRTFARSRALEPEELTAIATYRRLTPPKLVGARPTGFRKLPKE
jgi:hypothetical protein